MTKTNRTSRMESFADLVANRKKVKREELDKTTELSEAFIDVLSNPEVYRLLRKYSVFSHDLFNSIPDFPISNSTSLSDSPHTAWSLGLLKNVLGWELEPGRLNRFLRMGVSKLEPVLAGVSYSYGFRETGGNTLIIASSLLRSRKYQLCQMGILSDLISSQIIYEDYMFEDGNRGIGVFGWNGGREMGLTPKKLKDHVLNNFINPYLEAEVRGLTKNEL